MSALTLELARDGQPQILVSTAIDHHLPFIDEVLLLCLLLLLLFLLLLLLLRHRRLLPRAHTRWLLAASNPLTVRVCRIARAKHGARRHRRRVRR